MKSNSAREAAGTCPGSSPCRTASPGRPEPLSASRETLKFCRRSAQQSPRCQTRIRSTWVVAFRSMTISLPAPLFKVNVAAPVSIVVVDQRRAAPWATEPTNDSNVAPAISLRTQSAVVVRRHAGPERLDLADVQRRQAVVPHADEPADGQGADQIAVDHRIARAGERSVATRPCPRCRPGSIAPRRTAARCWCRPSGSVPPRGWCR